ncbi:MAG TPA: TlpA family protein disulfide reductase [Gammaproteobacteria bacterium]|nr:TlpA family protein disulfide reductase [Gammaproteobacteria bacterium]
MAGRAAINPFLMRLARPHSSFTARWLLLLALGLLSACEEPAPPLKVRVGQVVPPLTVQDLHNHAATIEPVPGKLLMLNVWATWCAPCRHEMPSLQRLAARLGSERLSLVGLSVDMDDHVVREYLIENKITFPSFLDRDLSEVNGVLGVRVFPSTFFIHPDGRLLKIVEGWREWDDPELVAEIRDLLPSRQGG